MGNDLAAKTGHLAITDPSPWFLRFAPLIRPGGAVLDVACGGGRHTRNLLGRGHAVTAVDRDTGPIGDLRGRAGLEIVETDLEDGSPWPFPGRTFACVVVVNYLYRPRFGSLLDALAPGGVLIYETFAKGNERYSRPRNPDHLLDEGELLALSETGGLRVVAYEHGLVDKGNCPGVVERICAVKGGDGPCPLEPAASPSS